ncbi:MAG: tRNA uridine(34) 5-carboxymethylaminomethyl modification radical SAM/GNAT enzyme Elp3 [Nitrososphaerota archaeon]
MTSERTVLAELVEEVLARRPATKEELNRIKLELAKRLRLERVPSDAELAGALLEKGADPELVRVVRKKPVKTRSGVTVITVVLPIFRCPHGRCVYCPGGGSTGIPQSYTGREAWVSAAREMGYEVEAQVRTQVDRLRRMGHEVDKVELIFIGGTFTAEPLELQRDRIRRALSALHGPSATLEEALEKAERSLPSVSGITVETKPDWAKAPVADELLRMGVTRVELGVQALDDVVYRIVNRGHTVRDVAEATADLRQRAFKVCYHLMPGLPGSDPHRDREWFRRLFEDPSFRPDMLKVYPTMVIPGTPLFEMWRRGLYEPYPLEEMVELLVDWLSIVPPYVRVMRIRREIPSEAVAAGAWPGNLRELVEGEMRRRGLRCRCVRCREIGNPEVLRRVEPSRLNFEVRELRYEASGGTEVFISYEDPESDVLAGLLRLRLPREPVEGLTEEAALVRELHVYGPMVPVGRDHVGGWQHRGIGALLLRRAEEIAASEGYRRILVISGVGVRRYYYRLGYVRALPYVAKLL